MGRGGFGWTLVARFFRYTHSRFFVWFLRGRQELAYSDHPRQDTLRGILFIHQLFLPS